MLEVDAPARGIGLAVRMRRGFMLKALKSFLLLGTASLLLAACGVRGSLEPPPDSGGGDGPEIVEGDGSSGGKRHDGFVLDGLLR